MFEQSIVAKALRNLDAQMRTPRRLNPKNALKLDYEELELVSGDDVRLSAWWTPAPNPTGAAIVYHHFGGQQATTLPWIRILVDAGLSVLCFDGRDHGSSEASPPGRHQFWSRAEDAVAALNEARRRVPNGALVAVGQSQNAASVAFAASMISPGPRPTAIIFDSGPAAELFSPSWGLSGTLDLGGESSWSRAVARVQVAAYFVIRGRPLQYSYRLGRALASLRETPLFWIHGDADKILPRRAAAVWYYALKSSCWGRISVPGAGHIRCAQAKNKELAQQLHRFAQLTDLPTDQAG